MSRLGSKNYNNKKCPAKSCKLSQRDIGFCGKHAQRFRRYGDPLYVTPEIDRRKNCRQAQPLLGTAKKTTYLKYLGRHLHRVVAEKKIGRPLKSNEIVHHIDGNRHNNKANNLEITTQSQHIQKHRKEMNRARWQS